MKVKSTIIIYIIIFSIFKDCFAEEDLLRVVITPTRFQENIIENNSFVEIITESDIEKSSATNLADLLNSKSSIGIASTGGPGSVQSYFIRGFAKKYIKISVDGMNISDPTATQTETYLQDIPLGDIKKIEILKSPQGPSHGGEAAGGVISITTKSGDYNKRAFHSKTEIGSYNSFYTGNYYSFGKDDYKVSANVNLYHTDGFSAGEKNNNTENDAYNYGNATFKLNKKFSNNNVTFVFRDSSSKYEYDKWDQTDNNDFTKTNIKSGLVKFEFKTGKNIEQKFIYNPTRVSRITSGSYNSDQSSSQQKLEYLIRKKNKNNSYIDIGAEHKNLKYKTGTTRVKTESNALILAGGVKPSSKTKVDLSVRRDHDQLYESHDTYRLQAGYKIDNEYKIKFSNGTGYRPPSMYERNNLASGITELKPEKTNNSEIGIEYNNYKKKLKITSSYFDGQIKDKIDYSGGGYRQVTEKTNIKGYEVLGQKSFSKNLAISSSYTYTDSQTNTNLRSKLVPMHKFSSSLDYDFNKFFNTNTSLIYQEKSYDTSRVELPSFTLLNSNLNYKFKEDLKLYLKFINILDQDYQVNRNYKTSDFALYTGIDAKF